MINQEELKTAEGRAQAYVNLRERETQLYREKAQLLALAVLHKEEGAAASAFVTSKRDVETWGNVGLRWGKDIDAAIEKESPLSAKWWQAILDCSDPDHVREVAHHEQLGSTQIRRRFGVVRHKQPDAPVYNGTATVIKHGAWDVMFQLNLAEEQPDLTAGDDVILIVRRRK